MVAILNVLVTLTVAWACVGSVPLGLNETVHNRENGTETNITSSLRNNTDANLDGKQKKLRSFDHLPGCPNDAIQYIRTTNFDTTLKRHVFRAVYAVSADECANLCRTHFFCRSAGYQPSANRCLLSYKRSVATCEGNFEEPNQIDNARPTNWWTSGAQSDPYTVGDASPDDSVDVWLDCDRCLHGSSPSLFEKSDLNGSTVNASDASQSPSSAEHDSTQADASTDPNDNASSTVAPSPAHLEYSSTPNESSSSIEPSSDSSALSNATESPNTTVTQANHTALDQSIQASTTPCPNQTHPTSSNSSANVSSSEAPIPASLLSNNSQADLNNATDLNSTLAYSGQNGTSPNSTLPTHAQNETSTLAPSTEENYTHIENVSVASLGDANDNNTSLENSTVNEIGNISNAGNISQHSNLTQDNESNLANATWSPPANATVASLSGIPQSNSSNSTSDNTTIHILLVYGDSDNSSLDSNRTANQTDHDVNLSTPSHSSSTVEGNEDHASDTTSESPGESGTNSTGDSTRHARKYTRRQSNGHSDGTQSSTTSAPEI